MEYAKNLRFLIFLVLIFYSLSLVSQDTWVKTYRPFQQQYLTDRYSVEDVLVTQDGGFVVSGSFELFDEFYYEHWGFLMKTDSDGNVLWAKKDSVDFMSENGYNVDFTELQDGSFISIGYQGFGGNRYMIKRDANGNRLWATSFDPNFGVFSMQTTDDSNVILAGRSDYNAALRKITPDGNLIWTNIIDLESSIAFSVDQADDGGYLLTGKSYIDDNNILVVKTNSNGDSLWTRTFDGLGGNDKGHCVIETADGNILIGGNVQVPSPDYGFGFLACLETNGDTLWTKIFDDGLFYTIGSLIETTDNNFVLQGGKLVKIDHNQDVVWVEPLTGDVFGGGDKNLQELQNGGFLCVSVEDYGDHITLNKTNSHGQVSFIESEVVCLNDYLLSNYPNPFNPETKINFNLPNNVSNPVIEIFNIKGEKVIDLSPHFDTAQCDRSVTWDGTDNDRNQVASGIYLYRLKTNHFVSQTKKMTLLK